MSTAEVASLQEQLRDVTSVLDAVQSYIVQLQKEHDDMGVRPQQSFQLRHGWSPLQFARHGACVRNSDACYPTNVLLRTNANERCACRVKVTVEALQTQVASLQAAQARTDGPGDAAQAYGRPDGARAAAPAGADAERIALAPWFAALAVLAAFVWAFSEQMTQGWGFVYDFQIRPLLQSLFGSRA